MLSKNSCGVNGVDIDIISTLLRLSSTFVWENGGRNLISGDFYNYLLDVVLRKKFRKWFVNANEEKTVRLHEGNISILFDLNDKEGCERKLDIAERR